MKQIKNDFEPPANIITPASRRDMRALAFHFLYAIDRHDYTVLLDTIIENFRKGFRIDITEDSLAVTMARGATEMREELDRQIKPLLRNWKLERLGCCTRLILRLALWELRQPEAIPSIVINEAIELAKNFAEKDAYKFVNGILDEASKQLQLTDQEEGANHDEPEESSKQ
ncbi:transcription antitermination factor NusB [Candidatus Dependentiae bacterium]|nr:transcription antitermination factor NusB [Candidatus Dependentiae bacterium]